MLLLIDAGNSNVKWATISSGQNTIQFGGVFSLSQPVENIIACFEKHWGQLSPAKIYISHVGPKLFTRLLQNWIQAIWNIQPTYLKTEHNRAGLINGYSEPMQLGVDRWLALLAAHSLYKQDNKAICIIDSGTCIKIDILAADGRHLGGCILPGKKMMSQSVTDLLAQNGKTIHKTDTVLAAGSSVVQKNTLSGILGGVDFSQVAVIEKLCRDLPKELGVACQVILTGGGGQTLTPLEVSDTIMYSPHLVLEGIAAYSCKSLIREKNVLKQTPSPICV